MVLTSYSRRLFSVTVFTAALLLVLLPSTGHADNRDADDTPITPTVWTYPEGVQRTSYFINRITAEGVIEPAPPVGPGTTFFVGFALENTSDSPVTVTDFISDFKVAMHPNRQADFPYDHCQQFFSTPDYEPRQTYPQVIEPGKQSSSSTTLPITTSTALYRMNVKLLASTLGHLSS